MQKSGADKDGPQKKTRKNFGSTKEALTRALKFGKIKRLYSGDRPIGPFNSGYSITSPV